MSIGMSTRVVFGLALGFAALAFSMAGSPPKAAADTGDCPAGYVCVWEGPTFGGQHKFYTGQETFCHKWVDFEGKSARNHTGEHTACFESSCIAPGAEIDLNRVFEVCIQ